MLEQLMYKETRKLAELNISFSMVLLFVILGWTMVK